MRPRARLGLAVFALLRFQAFKILNAVGNLEGLSIECMEQCRVRYLCRLLRLLWLGSIRPADGSLLEVQPCAAWSERPLEQRRPQRERGDNGTFVVSSVVVSSMALSRPSFRAPKTTRTWLLFCREWMVTTKTWSRKTTFRVFMQTSRWHSLSLQSEWVCSIRSTILATGEPSGMANKGSDTVKLNPWLKYPVLRRVHRAIRL
ncbi:hypothetical protein MTO96_001640 [Rhipicephalus appendiculatus]